MAFARRSTNRRWGKQASWGRRDDRRTRCGAAAARRRQGVAMECRAGVPMPGVNGGRIQQISLEEEKEKRKGLTGFASAARRGLRGEAAMDCVPG